MSKGEREGIDLLRKSIETIAADLEHRDPVRAGRRRVGRVVWSLAAAVVVVALIAVGLELLDRGSRTPEVEILELKLQGRPVEAVVVEGRATGTLVVMPGPERVAASEPVVVPEPVVWIEVARLSGGTR